MSLEQDVRKLYAEYGQRKAMGSAAPSPNLPHYFLLRTFLGENDLLVILNTKRCRYQCHFCQLPAKSSRSQIPEDAILSQFAYTIYETRHALSILDRITLSNEGSVLDAGTLPRSVLFRIAKCVHEIRRIRTLVLETRLEFVDPNLIERIKMDAPRVAVNILTGFETLDASIRDNILHKREPLEVFLNGLDRIQDCQSSLTSYVLFKPSPFMTDDDAYAEAERTIDFLAAECHARNIPLTIRLNPMYLAKGSEWARIATSAPSYRPPKLTDVMKLAERKANDGVKIYIGLSTEGLDDSGGTYMAREDFSSSLIRPIKLFNDGKLLRFSLQH